MIYEEFIIGAATSSNRLYNDIMWCLDLSRSVTTMTSQISHRQEVRLFCTRCYCPWDSAEAQVFK